MQSVLRSVHRDPRSVQSDLRNLQRHLRGVQSGLRRVQRRLRSMQRALRGLQRDLGSRIRPSSSVAIEPQMFLLNGSPFVLGRARCISAP